MEHEGSLPRLQETAPCSHSEPDQSSPLPTSNFVKIHFNIILPSIPGSPKWSLSLRFRHQYILYDSPLSHMRYIPAHLILLDFITRTILGEEYRSLAPHYVRFLQSTATSFIVDPNILLSTLFSKNLSLRSSLDMSDRVSHPYKKEAKLWFCIS